MLPQDQPANSDLRLTVRPGITGWAQINGGNLVTTEEKGALDEWYVHHASFWLDLRIALYTLAFLFTGERRFEHAVHEANAMQAKIQQKRDGDTEKPVVKRLEPGRTSAAPTQRPARLPISARARSSQHRRGNVD